MATDAMAALPAPAAALPAAAQSPDTTTLTRYTQAMTWRNIGPTRGGRSVTVTGVAGDDQTYYFGATGGGVWKTTDAGITWTNVSDGQFGTGSVGAVAVAESDPNVVWVGMGEHAVRGVTTSHGDGVYLSTDAGRSWTHMGLENTRAISRIRIHPRDPDIVYVAAQGAPYGETEDRGVYRTMDGGQSWEKVLYVSPRAGASALAMDMTNPRILYAAFWDHLRRPWVVESGGEGSGIWKSTDSATPGKRSTKVCRTWSARSASTFRARIPTGSSRSWRPSPIRAASTAPTTGELRGSRRTPTASSRPAPGTT